MRRVWFAMTWLGLLAATSPGVINVRLTADKTSLDPGQTTTIRVLAQGSSAGIYSLGGSVTVSGPAGMLAASSGSFAWVEAFKAGAAPFSPNLGSPGDNGGWARFGSMQTNFLSPDRTLGKADYVELASYAVTAQPGAASVTLHFVPGNVPGFPPVECDGSQVMGTVTDLKITVGTPVGQLGVVPSAGLAGGGAAGGPFTPSSVTYTLSNSGTVPLDWTASRTQSWVSLSKLAGTLAAGQSDTVTVGIAADANALAVGDYSDTVVFTNATGGIGSTVRPVGLVVSAPGQLNVSPATGLSSSGDAGGPFAPAGTSYTLRNTGATSIRWMAAATETWVSLSKTGGILPAGESDTVTVSIGSGAGSLNYGGHSATVTFHTAEDHGTFDRAVSLSVALTGDVDGDGIVGIVDALGMVRAFGTHQGQSGFDPACDLDHDGSVGMSDVLLLVTHFGRSR